MIIRDMFFKEIDRDIKGVIKVGQSDDENIYQELDEYVVTSELEKYMDQWRSSGTGKKILYGILSTMVILVVLMLLFALICIIRAPSLDLNDVSPDEYFTTVLDENGEEQVLITKVEKAEDGNLAFVVAEEEDVIQAVFDKYVALGVQAGLDGLTDAE